MKVINSTVTTPLFYNQTSFDWDISDETRQLIEHITGMYLAVLVSVFGILGNTLNLIVFCKQGLDSSINISFTLLSLSDICSLMTLLWYNICGSPALLVSNTLFFFGEVKHLTAGFPHGCFSRSSAWVIVWIMVERCLCVAFPLSIKRIITPKRTTIIIASIYIVMFISLVPIYYTKYLDWKFFPSLNKTLIGLVITEHSQELDSVSSSLFSSYMISSFLAVPVLSCILLVLYHSKNEWRRAIVTDVKTNEIMTNRERGIVKIVLFEGFIFTITYSVSAMVLIVCITMPQFSFVGQWANLYYVSFSFSFLLDAINSSIHFILYLKISSNFRTTFLELFRCLRITQKGKV